MFAVIFHFLILRQIVWNCNGTVQEICSTKSAYIDRDKAEAKPKPKPKPIAEAEVEFVCKTISLYSF